MFLGLVLVGMAFGAAAAGACILMGGSILLAVAVYSLFGTLCVLGTAVLEVVISERRDRGEENLAWALQPTE